MCRGHSEAGVDLAELKRGQCLYLIGELQPPRLLYCGKPAYPGKAGAPSTGACASILERRPALSE